MRLAFVFCALPLLVSLLSCRTINSSSQEKQETDDRSTGGREQLQDVGDIINTWYNAQLKEARLEVNPKGKAWTPELRQKLIDAMGRRTAAVRKGTGLGIHFKSLNFEISTLSEVEASLLERLTPEANQIHFTSFKDSRYGNNSIGFPDAKFFSHVTKTTADHSISPAIRVDETIFGLDKLGHFAEEGYWYYLAEKAGLLKGEKERLEFGQFMEGSPNLDPSLHAKYKKIYGTYCKTCVVLGGFGYFGMASTGVCSVADMMANEDGYRFYENLFSDPEKYVFDIRSFKISRWNESNSPNIYSPDLNISKEKAEGS